MQGFYHQQHDLGAAESWGLWSLGLICGSCVEVRTEGSMALPEVL